MLSFKRVVVGDPIRSSEGHHSLLSKTLALPIFCSDPLSSVAYATDEILLVLVLGLGEHLGRDIDREERARDLAAIAVDEQAERRTRRGSETRHQLATADTIKIICDWLAKHIEFQGRDAPAEERRSFDQRFFLLNPAGHAAYDAAPNDQAKTDILDSRKDWLRWRVDDPENEDPKRTSIAPGVRTPAFQRTGPVQERLHRTYEEIQHIMFVANFLASLLAAYGILRRQRRRPAHGERHDAPCHGISYSSRRMPYSSTSSKLRYTEANRT